MAQYVLMATLQSEDAADRFLNILIRKGLAVSALGQRRDPIVSGSGGSLVVLSVDTGWEDIGELKKFIQTHVASLPWVSFLLARAEGMTNLTWAVAKAATPNNPAQALAVAQARAENPNAPQAPDGFDEDEWFAQGEHIAYTAPEQEDIPG